MTRRLTPTPMSPTDGERRTPSSPDPRRTTALTVVAASILAISPFAAGAVGIGPFAADGGTAGPTTLGHEVGDAGSTSAGAAADRDPGAHQQPEAGAADAAQPGHSSHADGQIHAAALALVDPSAATTTAVASGPWSAGSTWSTGDAPTVGSRVLIPAGIVVTVDGRVTDAPKTIGVEGELRFAHDVDTELRVDTIVTHPGSLLQVGTPEQPIDADVTARVVFADDGPIDRDWDPTLLSRGAIVHGSTVVQGAEKTHRAVTASFPRAGDDVVELSSAPSGWRVGDEFVVTGTAGPTSDEVRRISAIDGAFITLDRPLDLDHVPPAPDLDLYVANLTRNVVFSSENTEVDRRGHLMVMHTLDAQIRGARFTDMGRTDKSRPLDDVEFDEIEPGAVGWNGAFEVLGGTNVRGRYSVHFHRGGADPRLTPAVVADSVVTGDPGWAFTNHSSHVDFERNVAHGNTGAGFFTEAGDEVGRWVDNIAIRTIMPNFQLGDAGAIDPDLRADRQDFGIDGDGFWLQGNRMHLIGNVSAGSTGHGLIWWAESLAEADTGAVAAVDVATLPDPSLVPERADIPVWWAPLGEVRDNVAYGSTVGFRSRYVHGASYLADPNSPPAAYIETLQPVFDGMVTWDVRDGVLMNYNERLTLRNIRAIGRAEPFRHNFGHTAAVGVGIDVGNDATFGPGVIEDIDVSGFEVGLIGPRHGLWTIDDATIAATTDVLLHAPEHTERALDMTDLTFADLDGTPLAGSTGERRHVVLAYEYAGDGDGVDPSTAGEPDPDVVRRADRVTLDGRGLYSDAIPADRVPGGGRAVPEVLNGVVGDPAPVPTITHVPGAGAFGEDGEFDDENGRDEDEFEDEEEFDDRDDRDENGRDEEEFDDGGDRDDHADSAFDRIEAVIWMLEGDEEFDESEIDLGLADRVRAIVAAEIDRTGEEEQAVDDVVDVLDELLDRLDDDGRDGEIADVGECSSDASSRGEALDRRLLCAILGTP